MSTPVIELADDGNEKSDHYSSCSDTDDAVEKTVLKEDGVDEFHDAIDQLEDIAEDSSLETKDAAPSEVVEDEDYKREQESALSEEDRESRKAQSSQLKEEGNVKFRTKEFKEAFDLYTAAIQICPLNCTQERSVLYSNRAATRVHLDAPWKEDELVINDCSKSISLNDRYLKPLIRRAQIYREQGSEKLDCALADYKKIIELDPTQREARGAVHELEAEINERNEKLKTEMMDKLKDLGNLVLKPFGLSTNNFQLNQNESGGYSVNFKQ